MITRTLDDPTADDRNICRAVRADEALTLSLLRYANSAWMARRHRARTVDEALTVVGLAGLRSLILTEFVGAFFTRSGPVHEFLWEHALASAIALALSHPGGGRETEDLYLCGLLHNVGKAILNAGDPHAYADVVTRVTQRGEDFCAAEQFVFRTAHPEAGFALLEEAPLPRIVQDTARYHHAPEAAPATAAVVCRKLLVADATAYRVSAAWRVLSGNEDPPWLRRRAEADPPPPFDEAVARELGRMRSSVRLPAANREVP